MMIIQNGNCEKCGSEFGHMNGNSTQIDPLIPA
jgi:hypothetical protein